MAANGPDVFGAVLSLGNNLIGQTDGSTGWLTLGQLSDITGTNANPKNPGLDPSGPTNNGGPTLTIQLAQGSPAFQTGSKLFAGDTDQRSYKRPQPPNKPSIGAYDPGAQNVGAILLPTSIVVASSADPSAVGQSVTFTATVTGSDGGTPTGEVTFVDGATVLGTAELYADVWYAYATYSTSSLAPGDHFITAFYSGDNTYDSSAAR